MIGKIVAEIQLAGLIEIIERKRIFPETTVPIGSLVE